MSHPATESWLAPREPSVTATDLVLATVAGGLALHLALVRGHDAARLFAAALAGAALAAALGGALHGWPSRLGQWRRRRCWRGALLAGAAAHAFLLAAAAVAVLPPPWRGVIAALAAAKFAGAAVLLARRPDILLLVLDGLAAYAAVAALFWLQWALQPAAAPWMIAGAAASLVAAVVQRSGVVPHRHCTNNDLYHVGQMIAAALFHQGALRLVA